MVGQLTSSSVPGEGSAFTVSLPRAADVIGIPSPGMPRGHHQPGQPGAGEAGAITNILYIEDNPVNIEVVSQGSCRTGRTRG